MDTQSACFTPTHQRAEQDEDGNYVAVLGAFDSEEDFKEMDAFKAAVALPWSQRRFAYGLLTDQVSHYSGSITGKSPLQGSRVSIGLLTQHLTSRLFDG